jgi:hypothetical protein
MGIAISSIPGESRIVDTNNSDHRGSRCTLFSTDAPGIRTQTGMGMTSGRPD